MLAYCTAVLLCGTALRRHQVTVIASGLLTAMRLVFVLTVVSAGYSRGTPSVPAVCCSYQSLLDYF